MKLGDLFDRMAHDLAGEGFRSRPAPTPATSIAAVLDKPRFWPTANQALELSAEMAAAIQRAGANMIRGMPLQYAVGKAAFRHLDLRGGPPGPHPASRD